MQRKPDTSPPDPTTRVVADFHITRTQLLRADGTLVDESAALPDANALTPLLETMLRTRALDSRAVNLQRTGQLGTYGANLGQEGIGVGVASAMRDDDVLFPTYREISAQLWRGVQMHEILLYWGGDERGSDFEQAREDFPLAVPIASQTLHAVGAAYAFKLRQQPRCAVVFLGDGASSKGDFYEALNAAGTWRLPILFVVVNNGWAISVPRDQQSACQTLAQKAIAGGFSGEQVDGNDALALRAASQRALAAMRDGAGPQLIEALTYRMGDHTTSDDARRYRSAAAVERHRAEDPIERLRTYLTGCGAWSAQAEAGAAAAIEAEVEAAVERYLATPADAPTAMFDQLYAQLPQALAAQRAEVERYARQGGAGDE